MKYSLALVILCSAIASSNAATLRDKIRLAQTRDFAECVHNCNSVNFSNSSRAQLREHWEMARKGLRRLAVLAQAPGPTQVVLFRFDELRCVSAHPPNGIGSLDIREAEATSQDPTGRFAILNANVFHRNAIDCRSRRDNPEHHQLYDRQQQ